MQRIPPSQRVRQRINQLMYDGVNGGVDMGSAVIRLGVERLVQEMLEQEVTDYLGRAHYRRYQPDQEQRGYRNGYETGHLDTAEGQVTVQVPQVRDCPTTYHSQVIASLRGRSDVLERLAVAMYTRGLSTRDIEAALEEASGDRLLSRSAVSELTETLWQEFEAFSERDLSEFEVEYLFVDAVYESLRLQGAGKEGVLCAWAICADGRRVMVHLALGNKESYANWLDFLRDMVRRGLCAPVLITSDGAPGLIRAIEEVFPNSLRQRCLAHKIRNVTDKVPDSARDEIKAAVQAAYYAPDAIVAEMVATDVLKRYQDRFPSAMKAFQDDWHACIVYLRCPRLHHKSIRTTNLLERSFLEQRRRTKTIPRFFTEKSCLKLVFATLWQASQSWHGVRMSEFERQQLKLLRRQLGLLAELPVEPFIENKAIAA